MKKIPSFLLLIISLFLVSSKPNKVLPIGSKLPMGEIKMKDVSGKDVSMKDAAGNNGLLVIFSCNTCPFVIKNEKRIIETAQLAKTSGIGVILLNSNEAYRAEDESYDAMKKYAASQKYDWYYVVDKDNQVADAFDAKRTPECFLFDKGMTLVYHGAIDDSPADAAAVKRQHLKEAISEMTSGKDITVKESRSVGCSIKRKS